MSSTPMQRALRTALRILGAVTMIAGTSSWAATPADIKKLNELTELLGRAEGCNFDVERQSRQVDKWIEKKFPPGSKDQEQHLKVARENMAQLAKAQAAEVAKKGDNVCAKVALKFHNYHWPK